MPCKLHCDRTLQLGWKKFCSRFCLHNCPSFCNIITNPNLSLRPPPSLPLPLPPRPFPSSVPLQQHADHSAGRILLLVIVIVTATIIVGVFMVCVLFKKLRQYRQSRREFPRRRNGPVLSDSDIPRENFADDDQHPVFDHHVWYINTIGLQQSVIDSITMFKYRKDEKLIDGTDCSVCLGEFQEDESLRLLPKCSHAFHAPCIDTWLRSHKNCPLCRAPVVSNSAAPNLTPAEPITNEPRPTQMETLQEEDSSFLINNQVEVGGGETSGEGASNINSNSRSDSEVPINKGLSRTLSDLAENQNRQAVEDEGQGIRRSVSMDSVSAMAIYEATSNIQIPEDACSSSGTLVEVKNPVWRNIPLRKPGIQNQSLYDLVKSISFGRSMQKGAISMKRFNSSSRKPVRSRHCRSHSSVLPL